MNNPSVIQLFNSLSKKEYRDLSKWVRSPFFNQREDVIRLLDYLWQIKEKKQAFVKQEAFEFVFPQQAYHDAKMRYALSFLHQQIKSYLSYSNWQKDPQDVRLHLCRQLRQHGQEEAFEKEMSLFNKSLAQSPIRNYHSHLQQYQWHLEQYEYTHQKRRTGAMNLQELSDELSAFYLSESLRINCLMQSHQVMSEEVRYQPLLLDEILTHLSQTELDNQPEIAIYYYAYLAQTETAIPSSFPKLKELLTSNWHCFPPDEIRDILLLAINYCIRQLNNGEQAFVKEAYDLYRFGIENEVLLVNGILSAFTYYNTLTLALMSDEFEWARQFLEDYRRFLPASGRKNTYLYNLAVYHFKLPDYSKVIELLRQVQFRDVFYNLDARRMLLRSYFELGEYQALDSLLDSFANFIRRRRELGYHKTNYLNLIRFVKKLLAIQPSDKGAMRALRGRVEETSALAEKQWLLEQLK